MIGIPRRAVLLLVILLLALVPGVGSLGGAVQGATLTVNRIADTIANDEACALREAIINANNDGQSGSTDCPLDTAGFPEDIRLIVPSLDETQPGGHVYIDPSGRVLDTSGNPIAGATVTLFRSDNATGPFSHVPDGSPIMSPSNRRNQDVADSNGAFGWDVLAGYYKVLAELPDCIFVESSVLIIPPPVTDLELVLDCEPLRLGADSSFTLHQDPSDGATGFKLFIARVFDSNSGDDVNVAIESFRAGFTYLDATANPAVPAGTRCVEILDGPRAMDFPITSFTIDNAAGSARFEGSDVDGVPWPADLGHILTRLNGSANQSCRVDLELSLKAANGGSPINVPPILTQILRRGDAQADGNVTIDDAVFIARYLVGSGDECTTLVVKRCLRWVNASGPRQDGPFDQITVADALFIAQYLMGLRDEFYNLVP